MGVSLKRHAIWVLLKRELSAARTGLLVTAVVMLLFALALTSLLRISTDAGKQAPATLRIEASIIDEDHSILGSMVAIYFENIKFVRRIYRDDLLQAMKRLKAGEILCAIYLPPGFMSESAAGSPKQSVEIWFNPGMQPEAYQIGLTFNQHAGALDFLYSNVFGYQNLYVELGGDEDLSWEKTSRQALNVVAAYLDRNRFTADGDLFEVHALTHALSGVLVILSILPSVGVLASTIRSRATSHEDRLLIACGYGPLMIVRLLAGLVWWALLILPILLALRAGGIARSAFMMSLLLFSAYLVSALVMLALGRIKAPGLTLLQAGWLVILLLIVSGGAIYPVSLFPLPLTRAASYTPLYPVMQAVYRALGENVILTSRELFPQLRSLVPASVIALTFGRRRL
ncbi:MAG: ABC transporter permease [Fastidiosipila sp.]|jgi:hypothetical protein|nr:ABC transporter permease [Fastidiosipila sp.]